MESHQAAFAHALADPDGAVPEGLLAWNAALPQRRFAVYRNNAAVGLRGALASRFPATERIVGPAFFAGMAEAFITAHPPRSPLLLAYGDDFADFVAAFPPAASLPYLADVIALEAARSRAYHAADCPSLDPSRLAAIEPERLGDLRLGLHPSMGLIRSAHPVVTLWAMNADILPLGPIDDWRGQDALVLRSQMLVTVHPLPPGMACLLQSLACGLTLAAAVASAEVESTAFDLTESLMIAVESGVFATIA